MNDLTRVTLWAVSLAAAMSVVGCSSDDAATEDSGGTTRTAACAASDTLTSAVAALESALVPGATEDSLDRALEPVDIAVDAMEATVPVDQRELYRAVEQASEMLDNAVDRLPEAGTYDQTQVDSVKDEVQALSDANAALSAGLTCSS